MRTSGIVERATLLAETARHREALALLGPYLATEPADARGWWRFGWSALALEDTGAARDAVAHLVELEPDGLDTHLLAAYVLNAEDRHEESDRAISRAIALAPHAVRPYFCSAQLDVMSGRVDYHTRRMARKAVELDPTDADNHRLLGTVLLEGDWPKDEWEEAEQHLRKALALEPATTSARSALSRLHARRDDWARALLERAAVARAHPEQRDAASSVLAAARVWVNGGLLSTGCAVLGMAFGWPLGPVAGRIVAGLLVGLLYRRLATPRTVPAAKLLGSLVRRQPWLGVQAASSVVGFLALVAFVIVPNVPPMFAGGAALLVGRLASFRATRRIDAEFPELDDTQQQRVVEPDSDEEEWYTASGAEEQDGVAVLFAARRYDDALTALRSRLSSNPGDLRAWELSGRAALGVYRLDLAREALIQLQLLAPEGAATHLLEARLLTVDGRHDEADRAVAAGIAAEPGTPAGYLCAAQLDLAADWVTDRTVEMARKAADLDPDEPVVRAVLRNVLKARRRAARKSVLTPAQPAETPWVPNPDPRAYRRRAEQAEAAKALTAGFVLNVAGLLGIVSTVLIQAEPYRRIGPALCGLLLVAFWGGSLGDEVTPALLLRAARSHRGLLLSALCDVVGSGLVLWSLILPTPRLIAPMVVCVVLGIYHLIRVPDEMTTPSLARRLAA